ncbi:MAG: zinc-ribbon domain-containing protein [Sphingorhabdus sp.]
MAKFCIQCGATLNEGARFCGECGAVVPVSGAVEEMTDVSTPALVTPEPSPAPPYTQPTMAPVSPPSSYEPQSYGVETMVEPDPKTDRKRPNWLLIGGGAGILLLLLAYYLIFLRDDASPSLEDRVKPEAKQTEAVAAKQYFAMTEANIRDRATAQGTSIVGKVARGGGIAGKIILGEDGTSDWLELADGKGFVAMVNLSETQPPELVKMLGDKSWTTDRAIEIWSQPDLTSELVDRVSAGTTLNLFGITANDFIEIKLKRGGVGYIADGARIAALADGKPIAIAFNPASCSFGPEIDALFTKLGDRVRTQYKEIENRDYPSEEAREKALGAMEGKSTFEKLQRNYQGLTVTGIAQHYESQSIYFADPPAKVIEVFRAQGHRIGRDGQFPSTDLYAGIGATQAQGARFGKADLSCGV